MKIRPKGYTKDIRQTIGGILGFWMIALGMAASFLALAVGFSECNNNNYEKYCKISKLANENLDIDQRKELIGTVDIIKEEDLGEDGFFVEHEKPITIKDASVGMYAVCIVILFCIISTLASIVYYNNCRNNHYFIADLPLSGYSAFLLIACFMIWPCFLVSRILFLRFRKKKAL